MATPSINIDVGSALPLLIDRMLKFVGRDAETLELTQWFSDLQSMALLDASTVQIIGMHTPIPISEIYQPTRISYPPTHVRGPKNDLILVPAKIITAEAFLAKKENAKIFAGPGWGKTTFLHHLFISLIKHPTIVPVLFTLRRTTAIADLTRFVEVLSKLKGKKAGSEFLILVDGFDEVTSPDNRKKVTESLLRFASYGVGIYYLTCREFYDVPDLKAVNVNIAAFSASDQLQYMTSFLKAYGNPSKAKDIIEDLRARNFTDFLEHPLLLALACIVRTGSANIYSRSVIKLIDLALDTLALRWDQSKGVSRQSVLPVDGRDRIRCMMRVAYYSESLRVKKDRVIQLSQDQLDLIGCETVDAAEVVRENAQFYGILIPIGSDTFQFVHRTLHDYLAARYWVETGSFQPGRIQKWNTQAAYAACLLTDATPAMRKALEDSQSFAAFAEILSNEPSFQHKEIAQCLINYYQSSKKNYFYQESKDKVVGQLKPDFVSIASTKFLLTIVSVCLGRARERITDVMLGYAFAELYRRNQKISDVSYSLLLRKFGGDKFNFSVFQTQGWQNIAMEQLKP